MRRLLYCCFIISLFSIVCSKKEELPEPVTPPVIAPPPAFGYYVIGYFPSYRDAAAVPDIKFRMCNVVNYAFGSDNSSGGLTIANPSMLTAVKTKAKAAGAKVMLSLNGEHADWQNMAATAAGRTGFIVQVMAAVRSNGLDGVDVDWEYPKTSDGTDVTYTALMKQLSDSCHLGSKHYVSAAITSGRYAGSIRDAVKSELWTGNYVDWFIIMAYDDFSTTALYKHHSDLALANICLSYWLTTRGMPAVKAVLGIPAYGRPSGITQTGTVLTYSGILAQGGSPFSDSATVTAAGFSNYTIYYNGQPTAKKKAILARQMGNGISIWEHSQDTHDATSLLKAVCDTIGRPY